MTAPDPTEIRAAVAHFMDVDSDTLYHIDNAASSAAACMNELWNRDRLGKSEQAGLSSLLEVRAITVHFRVRGFLIEEFLSAALTFAREFPDAPRARMEVTA